MGNPSVRICLLFFFIFHVFDITAFAKTFPEHPQIPEENADEQVTMIIVLSDQNLSKIKELIQKKYPEINICWEYKKTFTGFSVKGKKRDLDQLVKEPYIEHAEPVTTFQATVEESVPFIGGIDARGYFDAKDERLTGKGVKVAVIDTGIDYNHRDLQKNYQGGFDFVDQDKDPMETVAKDNSRTIHGTHVAGIIAANGKLKGVAPEASIIAYRALGPHGYGTTDQVIAAIEKSIEDQVDIVNLSLGNDVNGPDYPTSLALNRAVEEGITAVVSSGNSGPNIWTVGSPGTASKAISVGASTPPLDVKYLTLSGFQKKIPAESLFNSAPWTTIRGRIEYAGLGEKKDFKPSVKGKIALVKRGEITFAEKVKNAKSAGAQALIICNNMKGRFTGNLEEKLDFPVVSISKEDGEWLLKQLNEKSFIKTTIQIEQDRLAPFSSKGPVTVTWEVKPDLVAPGVAIDSTIPKGYMALQGTSMAAPHIAGAAALIKQKHPDWSPEQIKAAMMNTAKPLYDQNGRLYKVFEQGAGRIDILSAVQTRALIYPASLSFGQFHKNIGRKKKEITLTLENLSDQEKTFVFSKPHYQKGVQWQLPISVKVPANGKREVSVSIDVAPKSLREGLYDGTLVVTAGSQTIRLPYLFVVGEPNYPKIMGFEFGLADQGNMYHYELYLPQGADEFGIALYDPDTLTFKGFLDWQRNIPGGLLKRDISGQFKDIPNGVYKALIFAKKDGEESSYETTIILDKKILKSQ